ncbi:hypothetical protein ASE12_01955 [Aeromicrobium sp. Root236]|uniref:hypothetical protein n=1 Tax=Aeromicrobium sp. Root236 TaxID=1736498 RepID=UPI0006F7153E|nr:hypothetical protein [Aeromicrobium sp. Root236]KRC63634.1 hypothetical protein ASE12_01955 [Aeromicrobium sp. Root236]
MSSPGYRLVAAARELNLSDRFFRRFRRVGLRGVLADLNRTGAHADVPGEAAIAGMTWQDDDRDTERWYPQGITTSADAYGADPSGGMYEGHDVVIASWYAHGWRGWLQLGSRISVIDWSDDDPPRYRHVLLTAPKRLGFFHRLRPVRVHAGGIVWYGDHLFVAGSSSGVRVFRLDDIVRVRNRLRTKGYRYVLPQYSFYAAEHDADGDRMTYSFMSLDRAGDEDHLVAGEYGRKGGSHRLIRYAIDRDTQLLRSDDRGWAVATELHDRQIARMQGAVVFDGLWAITSSNGEGNPGDLWVGSPGDYTRHAGILPTGPEDITYLPQRRWLWSLTEWPGRRWVYAIDADRWRPAPNDPS